MTIILGLLVFSVLVIVHEYGHFAVARWLGVRVERFSIGFGPVVFSRRRGDTQIALSALPLGGYVKMAGDDPRDRSRLRPGDLFAASWWHRVLIALAGPGANFLFAVVLGITLAWVGVRSPDAPNEIGKVTAGSVAAELGFRTGDRITEVDGRPVTWRSEIVERLLAAPGASRIVVEGGGAPARDITVPADRMTALLESLNFPYPAVVGDVGIGQPAYDAGLQVDDRILAIDGRPVTSFSDMSAIIRESPGRRIEMRIQRGDRVFLIPITPAAVEVGGETIGRIGIGAASERTYVQRYGFFDGITVGSRVALVAVGLTAKGITDLVSGRASPSQISGPVAIIQASGAAAKSGPDALLNFALFISIALMVFNLLPIPILDGGMVFLSVLEAARRRPVGAKGLAVYQGIGMAVIGTLLVFVLINDPHRIWKRYTAMDRATEVEQGTEEAP